MTRYSYAKGLLYENSDGLMKIHQRDLASFLLLLNVKECGVILEKIKDQRFYVKVIGELISKNPGKVIDIVCGRHVSLERFMKASKYLFSIKKELLLMFARRKGEYYKERTLERLFTFKVL